MAGRDLDITWFTRKGGRLDPPLVTLSTLSTLGINASGYEMLGCPEHVQLGYDEGKKVVAIRAARADDASTYKVSRDGKVRSYSVHLSSFLKYWGIDHSKTRRYALELRDGYLIFDLAKAVLVREPATKAQPRRR